MDIQTTFSSLPGEILIQILENLGWDDLNAARQVCTSLYDAHQSRSVWISLIQTYSERYMATQHACLEKPVEHYTTAELKKRFSQWMKVERSMRPQNERIEISRPFEVRNPNRWVTAGQAQKKKEVHILRGGRWLLYSDSNEILYCDLYQETLSEPLVPINLITIFDTTKILMLIDEHNQLPQEFTLAILYCGPSDQRGRWEFYAGRLILDDKGLDIGLEVTFNARVWSPCKIPSNLCRISLLGSHIACYTFVGNVKCLVIVNWRTANENMDCPFKTITPQSLRRLEHWDESIEELDDFDIEISLLYLLGEERILLGTCNGFAIYDHSTWPEQTDLPLNFPTNLVQPIVYIPLFPQPKGDHISRPFITHDSLRIIFIYDIFLYGLTIEWVPPGQIYSEMTRLLDFPKSWRASMDLRKFYFTYTYGMAWKPYQSPSFGSKEAPSELYFLRYFWPEERGRNFRSGLGKVTLVPRRHMGEKDEMTMDPTSGKVVLAYASSATVVCYSIT